MGLGLGLGLGLGVGLGFGLGLGLGFELGFAHLGHEAEVLARMPLESVPRDPARGVLPGGRRVALAEGPAVLIARCRADDPARHVVVRVHAVEEMGVAAVHRVMLVVRPVVTQRHLFIELPISVEVVVPG